MPDHLDQASAWLESQRAKHLTRMVIYQRGDQRLELAATVGRSEFDVDDGNGAVLLIRTRDYLISTADLVLGGTRALPQVGDQVRETQDDQVYVHEVMAPGSEPCWRYSDPYRRTLRIHTKEVDQEQEPPS